MPFFNLGQNTAQVDENGTIRTCADTEWMKTELAEPVLTSSE